MNKITTRLIPIKTLPSGEELSLKVFNIKGSKKGPKVHLQASVHGAELQGNVVIYELLKHFQENDFCGEIQFVPLANPSATNTKMGSYTYGRFNPITGENWNRAYEDIFDSSCEQRSSSLSDFVEKIESKSDDEITALFKKFLLENINAVSDNLSVYGKSEDKDLFLTLQSLASDSDCVLDLHTAPVGTRYIYTPEYALESAKKLGFPHYIIIPSEFGKAMDEASFMPWIHLQRALSNKGRDFKVPFQSFTLELGSEEQISFEDAKLDAQRIINYLDTEWNMIKSLEDLDKVAQFGCHLKDYKTYHSPKGALYDLIASPADHLKKGDLLAKGLCFANSTIKDLVKADDLYFELLAKNDCIVINNFGTSSIPSGAEIYQVMEKVIKFK